MRTRTPHARLEMIDRYDWSQPQTGHLTTWRHRLRFVLVHDIIRGSLRPLQGLEWQHSPSNHRQAACVHYDRRLPLPRIGSTAARRQKWKFTQTRQTDRPLEDRLTFPGARVTARSGEVDRSTPVIFAMDAFETFSTSSSLISSSRPSSFDLPKAWGASMPETSTSKLTPAAV